MVQVLQGLTGRTKDTIYDLFFDEKKVVFAIVLHPSDLAGMYKRDLLTVFLGGALKYGEIKMKSEKIIKERRLTYQNKDAEEVLAMNKANVELYYEDIDSIAIKKRFFSTYLEFRADKRWKRKIVFHLRRNQVDQVEKVIDSIFPQNVLDDS